MDPSEPEEGQRDARENEDQPASKKQRIEPVDPKVKERRNKQKAACTKITEGMRRRDPQFCAAALLEALDAGYNVPASTVAGVLRQFELSQQYAEGIQCYETVIRAKYSPAQETISTVLMRLQCHASTDLSSLQERVAAMAASLHESGQLKRRFFSEPLKLFMDKAIAGVKEAAGAALSIFEAAKKFGIEFWDEDFLAVITALRVGGDVAATESVLTTMIEYQPVVGYRLAISIHAALTGCEPASQVADISVDVSKDGTCSGCKNRLESFDFSPADRSSLLLDIEMRLIVPSIRLFAATGSHRGLRAGGESVAASTSAAPTDAELRPFEAFKQLMNQACVPVPEGFVTACILDGANIGYYNVSAWYEVAKKEVLRAKGVDLAGISPSELDHSSRKGLAMDVPLNFEAIDAAIHAALARKWFPVVVLHERHLQKSFITEKNQAYLDKWSAMAAERCRPLVIPSPSALNDDFAWLYSSVHQRSYVVTNDLMRDHHYATLSRRSFLRWRSRYRVPFSCYWPRLPRDASKNVNGLCFNLSHPDPFSTWIQRATVAGPSSIWHIPYYENVAVIEQSTNEVKTEEELQKQSAETDSIRWVCAISCPK